MGILWAPSRRLRTPVEIPPGLTTEISTISAYSFHSWIPNPVSYSATESSISVSFPISYRPAAWPLLLPSLPVPVTITVFH